MPKPQLAVVVAGYDVAELIKAYRRGLSIRAICTEYSRLGLDPLTYGGVRLALIAHGVPLRGRGGNGTPTKAQPNDTIRTVMVALTAERQRQGLTRRALARRAGGRVPGSWEIGRWDPNWDAVQQLARGLGKKLTVTVQPREQSDPPIDVTTVRPAERDILRLLKLRQRQLEITVYEAAKAAGIFPNQVRGWYRGEHTPRFSSLQKLALGVRLELGVRIDDA